MFRHYDFLRILKCLTPFLSGPYRESNPIHYQYSRNTHYFPWIICGKLGSLKENGAVTPFGGGIPHKLPHKIRSGLVAALLNCSLTKYVPARPNFE